MNPDDLAAELEIPAKAIRAYLRATFPRSPAQHSQRWELDDQLASAVRTHFAARPHETAPERAAQPPQVEIANPRDELSVSDFIEAPLYRRAEVLAVPCPVPRSPGVYGWWFRELPAVIDTSGCLRRTDLTLLYVGISPRRPSANGRAPSNQTLRSRIRTHYTGNAEGSTLRKTLGVLLAGQLEIELRRVGSGTRMTFVEGEQQLSEWMADVALVSWIVHPKPWLAEHRLISTLDLPLNLDANSHNPFHPALTAARARAVASARAKPLMANPGIGGA